MTNNIKNVSENECCGCGACKQKCPKACIEMIENQRGFLMPIVDEKKCIECGACLRVCPEKNDIKLETEKKSYAAIVKDIDLLQTSTSGGVFGQFALCVLSQEGAVYGCAWKKDFSVNHIRIDKADDLSKIQQSKYVQSDTENTFQMVKKDLKDGKKVLYSGTACQIAGLKNYLNFEDDNLLTIEVACHGVPSPGLFKKYIQWIEEINKYKVSSFQFRNKKKHKKGEHYKFCITFENGKEKYGLSNEDAYYGSFLEGRTLRETCFHCKYKQLDRPSDILLSDYWGIEKEHKRFPSTRGASAVVICSKKGEKAFETIKEHLIYEESTLDKIARHNRSIVTSAKCKEGKKIDNINISNNQLFSILKPNINLKKRIRNLIPENIKYLIKRI